MVQGIIIPASESKAVVCAEFATLEDYQRLVGGWQGHWRPPLPPWMLDGCGVERTPGVPIRGRPGTD